jgi:hypothetical protein
VKEERRIEAVIGVRHEGDRTWYVKRSGLMENYPFVWSLLSTRIAPEGLPDPTDTRAADRIVRSMTAERLGGADVSVLRYLTSGESSRTLPGRHVTLHLYSVAVTSNVRLNPRYYVDSRWMTPEEYEQANAGMQCGLCLRLWSDYAYLTGISERPFAPSPESVHG